MEEVNGAGNNESTIYLQVGPTSNLVSAHSWNIRGKNQRSSLCCDSYHKVQKDESTTFYPRTVVIDFDENMPSFNLDSSIGDFDKSELSSFWTGPISTYNLGASSTSDNSHRSSTSLNGMNVLEAELHRNSTVALPVWTTPERFDSFHKGSHESSCGEIPYSFVESVTDKVRYFAEAVDQLNAISVMSDLQGGFGGLCSSLLSEIRDDYGNHVMIPVWGMTDSLQPYPNSWDTLDESDLKHQLHRLDLPLCYGGIIEHSNNFLPLASNSQCIRKFFGIPATASILHETSLSCIALAAVMECANYSSYGQSSGGVVEWCAKVSGSGRWPVGLLEGFLCSDRPAAEMKRSIQAICEQLTCFNSDEHREHTSSRIVAVQSDNDMRCLNPFMESFSSVLLNTSRSIADQVYLKPYTNLLLIRSGDDSAGLARYFFEKSSNSSYYVTGCRQATEPISIPYNMSAFVSGVTGHGENRMRGSVLGDGMVLSGIGAVGTSTRVGEHLQAVAAGFAARSSRAQVQLNKVGMDPEVCLELQETLMSLANRYNF